MRTPKGVRIPSMNVGFTDERPNWALTDEA
jgi:hypothetical protein